MLESGQLVDSMGKRCSFRNAVLVLTTSPTTAPLPAGLAPAAASSAGSSSGGSDGGSSGGTTVVQVPEGHVHPEAYASGDSGRHGGGGHSAHSAAAQALQPGCGDSAQQGAVGAGAGAAAPVHPLRYVPAELLSRLDAAVSMQPLSAADMRRVLELQLAECCAALEQQGVRLTVDDAAAEWLATHGCSPVSGAARLQPLLREQLLLPAAEALLEARLASGRRASEPLAVAAGVAPDGCGLRLWAG